jgi:hypothetical protein
MVTMTPIGPKDPRGNDICADCAAGNHVSHDPDREVMRRWLLQGRTTDITRAVWKDSFDCKNELTRDGRTVAQCMCRANMPEACVNCGLPEFVHFAVPKWPPTPVADCQFRSQREDREDEKEMLRKHGTGPGGMRGAR